jgi:uncharacterized protein (DUF1499 family)
MAHSQGTLSSMTYRLLLFLSTVLVAATICCAGAVPATLGVQPKGGLAPCPDSPNCVSSLDDRADHGVEPIQLAGDVATNWEMLRGAVEELPGTVVVIQDDHYLHAESTSSLMRYVDDLELLLDPATGRVDVRSASRVGYGDMGVNSARVELLRELANERGLRQ